MIIDEHIKEYRRRIEVMQAAKEGKEIEFATLQRNGRGGVGWFKCNCPLWDWTEYDYRVRPEPREVWINIYGDDKKVGVGAVQAFGSREQAQDNRLLGMASTAVCFREVLE